MESMKLTIAQVLIATICSTLVIFSERAFPFVLFSKKQPPRMIKFIEKYIPPMVMAALLVYCLKDMTFSSGAVNFAPYLAGVAATAILHLWKGNSLISIFGGTIIYMILIRIL
jgi:branched-subunit amino acid transport protein AzlD